MTETCIVCLGDLDVTLDHPDIGHSLDACPRVNSIIDGTAGQVDLNVHATATYTVPESGLIAHLLPCGHNLHNECLKPWVERANSCPICRASFNTVELSAKVGDHVFSSYSVEDKLQVADIDPTIIYEDDDIENSVEPCLECEEYGDEEVLLLCDGCPATCHTVCAGLDHVPAGQWFCPMCQQGAANEERPTRRSPSRARTSARQRRSVPYAGRSTAWAQVWQQVRDRLDLDLDFPFDDDQQVPQSVMAQRREFNAWQRRYQIAARQGGASRFMAAARPLLSQRASREPAEAPKQESQDELRAWNAFDKAKEVQEGAARSRKRKSVTSSPSEPVAPVERKLKRPRTRRANEPQEPLSDSYAESSTARRTPSLSINTTHFVAKDVETDEPEPSFLQSLLDEVETTSVEAGDYSHTHDSSAFAVDHPASSPRMSPCASPSASNHATPRAMTPPPRPNSPPPLTSTVSPIFPPAPEFPPYSPADDVNDTHDHNEARKTSDRPASRHGKRARQPSASSPHRSKDSSPTRASMSFSTKSEIQKMVSSALKPLYLTQEISKEEYTEINRDVSRLLYDCVGDASALMSHSERDHWQQIAVKEVRNAIKALRTDVVDTAAS